MDDDKTNVSDSGSIPANIGEQLEDENQKHRQAEADDQSGELDPLGENDDNEPLVIDEAMNKVGLKGDEDGVHPLDSTVIDDNLEEE